MDSTIATMLSALIAQQEAKLAAYATRINPRLTADDLRQPHDFPELAGDPGFNYEDGILTGLRSVEAALRAGRVSVTGERS